MSQNVNHKDFIENEILRRVNKPSQYLGTELNSVHKDLTTVDLRFSLVFPDMYEVGLGNLGLHILYAILNKHTDVWAERAYAPGMDMEAELRKHEIPLFALESKDSLEIFDGLGFTLQPELSYTNILNILDLSNIPLRTADRGEDHPLTFCGGPAVFNPEPLVYFMDFFVFGDGEDVINEIVDVFRQHTTRAARLEALSQVDGIYVPALYPIDVLEDGQILPSQEAPKIVKRIAPDLNAAEFPVDYLVPFTRQIHDRISLEVLRGCTQGYRFYQAGMVTRPVRERSIDNTETLMERTLVATGYEEVELKSIALMAAVTGMDYIMYVSENSASVNKKIVALLAQDEVLVERKKKQRKNREGRRGRRPIGPVIRQIDMRPNIGSLSVSVPEALRKEDGSTAIAVELHRVGDRGMRPSELLKLLEHDIESCHVLRLRTRFSSVVGQVKASVVPVESSALNSK